MTFKSDPSSATMKLIDSYSGWLMWKSCGAELCAQIRPGGRSCRVSRMGPWDRRPVNRAVNTAARGKV